MDVRCAVDQGDVEGVPHPVQEGPDSALRRAPRLRRHLVEPGQVPRPRYEPDVIKPRGTEQGLQDWLQGIVVQGRDARRPENAAHSLRAPEPLGQGRLGIVVDQEHTPAGPGEGAGEMMTGRGLTDPAFGIDEGECDSHAAGPSVSAWSTVDHTNWVSARSTVDQPFFYSPGGAAQGRARGSPCRTKTTRSPPRSTGFT